MTDKLFTVMKFHFCFLSIFSHAGCRLVAGGASWYWHLVATIFTAVPMLLCMPLITNLPAALHQREDSRMRLLLHGVLCIPVLVRIMCVCACVCVSKTTSMVALDWLFSVLYD